MYSLFRIYTWQEPFKGTTLDIQGKSPVAIQASCGEACTLRNQYLLSTGPRKHLPSENCIPSPLQPTDDPVQPNLGGQPQERPQAELPSHAALEFLTQQ